jgi:hypothetical protein
MAKQLALSEWLQKIKHHEHKAKMHRERSLWHEQRAREATEKLHAEADKRRDPKLDRGEL